MSRADPTIKQMLTAITMPTENSTAHGAVHEATYLHLFLLRLAQDIPEVAERIKQRFADMNKGD